MILNSPGVSQAGHEKSFGTAQDIVGIIIWTVGWLIESIGDVQKVDTYQDLLSQLILITKFL